jgi:hypothetical protein
MNRTSRQNDGALGPPQPHEPRKSRSVNLKGNLADGGVDAAVRGAPSTDYLPAGDSAWQFKQGDLRPAACATEFANADWAHEFVRAGGSYVLVLGASLSDKLIENRRKKIADKAIKLNLLAGIPIPVSGCQPTRRWPRVRRSRLRDMGFRTASRQAMGR